MAIKILPNMMPGSTIYTATTNVVQQQYANPYTKSCSGLGNCNSYNAVVKCLISIYQGVDACQTIYLLDKDGNLIDTDRLDFVRVLIYNIYGCNVSGFDSREFGDGSISFPQTKYDGEIFNITPDNFNDIMFGDGSPMFDVDEDSIYLRNGRIFVYSGGRATPFITAPVEYREKMTVKPMVSEMYGNPTLSIRANGSPNVLIPNEDNDIIMLTESDDGCILEFGVSCKGSEAGFYLDSMQFRTVGGIANQGEVRICFSEGSTANMLPSTLSATVMFKFKNDDETEKGSTHVVTCVPIGTLYRNDMLDKDEGGDEGGGSGGSSDGGSGGTYYTEDKNDGSTEYSAETELTDIRSSEDAQYNASRHYEAQCSYTTDFLRGGYFWLVDHGLGLRLTHRNGVLTADGVNITALDGSGNRLEYEIEYISGDTLLVWIDEAVDGKVIIN